MRLAARHHPPRVCHGLHLLRGPHEHRHHPRRVRFPGHSAQPERRHTFRVLRGLPLHAGPGRCPRAALRRQDSAAAGHGDVDGLRRADAGLGARGLRAPLPRSCGRGHRSGPPDAHAARACELLGAIARTRLPRLRRDLGPGVRLRARKRHHAAAPPVGRGARVRRLGRRSGVGRPRLRRPGRLCTRAPRVLRPDGRGALAPAPPGRAPHSRRAGCSWPGVGPALAPAPLAVRLGHRCGPRGHELRVVCRAVVDADLLCAGAWP
mmetsp:Transcript_2228/g.6724  ORF Transcript_2228/g.6724 Transcript_2228/m.6724 type:complete len:264 (+) Transcript_2228:193-984(+)